MELLLAMLGAKIITSTIVVKLFNYKKWCKKKMAVIMAVLWTPVVYAGYAIAIPL